MSIAEAITGWICANPHLARHQRHFAAAVGISEGRLSQVMSGSPPSKNLAVRIHKFTGGAVPGSLLRPDIWRRPEDVPVDDDVQTEAAQ